MAPILQNHPKGGLYGQAVRVKRTYDQSSSMSDRACYQELGISNPQRFWTNSDRLRVGTVEADDVYNSNMQTGAGSLPYGIYFGASQARRELPGFSVSLLTPMLRAEDVPLHRHQNASF